MIKALECDFQKSLHATDENSRAYCAVLKGESPPTSQNTHTHVASRLLAMRFLDIHQALANDIDIKPEVVSRKNPISVLKNNVCMFQITPIYIVTSAFDQDLSDWVETISKALSILQSAQATI